MTVGLGGQAEVPDVFRGVFCLGHAAHAEPVKDGFSWLAFQGT